MEYPLKSTSFGTMRTLIEKNDKIISEYLVFDKEGRGHIHNEWEICYVTEGSGYIMVGEDKVKVKEGDVCKIPPQTNHWMIPEPSMEILLVYSKEC